MSSGKPKLLLVSLLNNFHFVLANSRLLSKLNTLAEIQYTKDKGEIPELLSKEQKPAAVLLTDWALTKEGLMDIWEMIIDYARGGGIVVAMGLFSAQVQVTRLRPFFSQAGLPWIPGKAGEPDLLELPHTAEDMRLEQKLPLSPNPEALGEDIAKILPRDYNPMALYLSQVSPSEQWYIVDPESRWAAAFPEATANMAGETPVAMGFVGDGKLGFVGDVTASEATDAIVLTMCGFSLSEN